MGKHSILHDRDLEMEIKVVFNGTAKLNEITKNTIWADGKIYKVINDKEAVLCRDRSYADWPNFCPFAKSSDLWGMTIYSTAHVEYFTFEIA